MAICSKESLQLFLGTTLFLRNIVFVPRKNFAHRKYFACSMKRLCLWVMASKESRQLFLRKTLFLGKILFVHRKTFFLGHFLFVSKKITANIFLFPGKHLFKIVQILFKNFLKKLILPYYNNFFFKSIVHRIGDFRSGTNSGSVLGKTRYCIIQCTVYGYGFDNKGPDPQHWMIN